MGFSLDIKKFVQKCGANADLVIRKTLFDIGTRLVEKTPVGDADYWLSPPPPGYVGGHARANWTHSVSTRVIKEVIGVDPSGGNTISELVASVPVKGAAGKIHYIQNSVPYIERLEDGWSRQAPNGMVAITVAEFNGIVDSATKGLK